MSKQQNDFTDASSSDNKKELYESSTVEVDSGIYSEELSSEKNEQGSKDEHKKKNTENIPEEGKDMFVDSGIIPDSRAITDSGVITDSLKDLVITGTESLNNLNSIPAPVDPISKPPENTSCIPPRIYYEQDEEGDTHLHLSIAHGLVDVVLALIRSVPHPAFLDISNDDNLTPMHIAAETGQWKIVRLLRIAGANPCPRGRQGDSPLHIAARRNDTKTVEAIVKPVQEKRELLGLSYTERIQPCDFDQWNFLGQTCLHVAAIHGHLDVLKHLIWYGANINAREGCMGYTALHYAVETGNEEIVQFLLGCPKIDVECISYGGKDALEINRFAPSKIRQALKSRGLLSPYSSEDEIDSDSGDDMMYDNNHQFTTPMVNASA